MGVRGRVIEGERARLIDALGKQIAGTAQAWAVLHDRDFSELPMTLESISGTVLNRLKEAQSRLQASYLRAQDRYALLDFDKRVTPQRR